MEIQIPSFVNRNPDIVMSEIKSQMEAMLGRQLQPAQLEQLILQIIGYREILLLERFNAGMAQLLYQFSHAPVLDYIAALVAVERLPASHAGCVIQFTLVPGHGNVVIPGGTRVATQDGIIFATTEDLIISASDDVMDVVATAQVAGKAANGIEPGKISLILDPLAFVSAAANITVPGGGGDTETDESLRERIKLAPTQYSTAGSRASYTFHAKSANPSIIDVSVSSPIPGTVFIVPLLESGTYDQVIQDIYNTCSAETVRPLTDTVIVSEPSEINYTIEVDLIVYEGVDITAAQTDVLRILQEFSTQRSRRLGADIIKSHIIQACRIPQVYDVAVTEPMSNIIVDFDQVPICTGIIVGVSGVNYG